MIREFSDNYKYYYEGQSAKLGEDSSGTWVLRRFKFIDDGDYGVPEEDLDIPPGIFFEIVNYNRSGTSRYYWYGYEVDFMGDITPDPYNDCQEGYQATALLDTLKSISRSHRPNATIKEVAKRMLRDYREEFIMP